MKFFRVLVEKLHNSQGSVTSIDFWGKKLIFQEIHEKIKYIADQRLNLILSEKVRLKWLYRNHYFTMSRSEQVNLRICSILLWPENFRIWCQTAYPSLPTKYKVFLKIKLRLNFKMSLTQYEFEWYRIFWIDNVHRSYILLCEKRKKKLKINVFHPFFYKLRQIQTLKF